GCSMFRVHASTSACGVVPAPAIKRQHFVRGHPVALKVIGAGFGRTGTRSLKEALEILGYAPCHHMMEVFVNPQKEVPFWDRAAQGEKMDWEELFSRYQSACDWPSCSFYQELADYYPDAKVILSLRDAKSWYKSVSSTIMPSMKKPTIGPDGKP